MPVAFKEDYMSQKALLSPRGTAELQCLKATLLGMGASGVLPPPGIISEGFTQTPSLTGFCCLCLPFTWRVITSINICVCSL